MFNSRVRLGHKLSASELSQFKSAVVVIQCQDRNQRVQVAEREEEKI